MSILAIGLGLLGLGGAGAGIAIFAPAVAKTAFGFLRGISPKSWIAIGVGALLIIGFFVHQHKAHEALAAEYARGKSDEDRLWQKRLDQAHAEALQWKAKAEAADKKISQEERAKNEAEHEAIAARADNQRMHGPGAAAAPACVGSSNRAGVPAASGGPGAADRDAGAGLAIVPSTEPLAVVPWNDLVSVAEHADNWRSEALTWREWYARQAAQSGSR